MLTTLCIIFTTEAFFPKGLLGESKTSMTFAIYTLILSLFTGSFGITKFFLKGPLPVLPKDAPLAGLLSFKFLNLLLLNTMFVIRTFCLEASFFTSYRSGDPKLTNIEPLIPEEYRLIIYLLPALLSLIINLVKLALSMKLKDFRYFKKFPQFILCPMFSPLMFEGDPDRRDDNEPPVRVWKVGSIMNSVFIGCLPQILLVTFENYKGVPLWSQNAEVSKLEGYYYDSNALIRYPFGNTIFSITSFLLYLVLTTIFFAWERIFKDNGVLCKYCKSSCPPCLNTRSARQSEESDLSARNGKDDSECCSEQRIRNPSADGSIQDTEPEERQTEVTTYAY